MYACRAEEGEGEREGEGEEEEEELLPDRSEHSLSLLLDLLAECDRRAGFFFFLLIFETEALDPPAFGGSSIMSCGSISFALPFKIVVSRLLISLTCNVRASIDDWQEYKIFCRFGPFSQHSPHIKTCRSGHHLLLHLPELVFCSFHW